MLSRPERKASQINHSPKKAKQHWIYDFAEVVRLYNIHPNTLRNWSSRGCPISGMARSACFAVRTLMRSIERDVNVGSFPASLANCIACDVDSLTPS